MNKEIIFNIILIVLCIIAIVINSFYDELKWLGISCLILMAIMALFKNKIIKK